MIELGTILIQDSAAIVGARNKLRLLAEDLKFDSVTCTRLAVITSELCRSLYQADGNTSVFVGFDKREFGVDLVLIFQGSVTPSIVQKASVFFDRIDVPVTGNGGACLVGFKRIQDPAFEPTESFVKNKRELLIQLSRAELLIEVQRKNRELQSLLDELRLSAEKEKKLAAEAATAEAERKKSRELTKAYRELEKVREQEYHLANYDTVTELPNRAFFRDRLQQAIAQAERHKQLLAVLFLDLDHFKNVNDTLGHAMGDQLLRMVAERIQGCVRKSDTVARLGGDEFTLILIDITRIETADLIARNIIKALSLPFILGGREFFLGASIGISIYPEDGKEAEFLVRNADTAMYKVKRSGRNSHQFYTLNMSTQASERLDMENGLRKAIKQGELELYYQPQLDCASGLIVSTEALLRWRHPEKGFISPDTFIPLAEESGLIFDIGEWVLRAACAQNKAWQDEGLPPIRVAVNLSMRQFEQSYLVEEVIRVLKETGLATQWLELELTEGVFLHDVHRASAVLAKLRGLGVSISIDDFGTGYSSLSQLRRLPIDTVKIDRSFIQRLTSDPDDAAIVTAIIALARKLNLNVIAEGVESEAQLALLREYLCNNWQGYLFSKPVPADAFKELLISNLGVGNIDERKRG